VVKITDNSVGDAVAKQIANALITNTSLVWLWLRGMLFLFGLKFQILCVVEVWMLCVSRDCITCHPEYFGCEICE